MGVVGVGQGVMPFGQGIHFRLVSTHRCPSNPTSRASPTAVPIREPRNLDLKVSFSIGCLGR
jgi:hypothetical protein